MLVKVAREALPDSGLVIIKVISSEGTPIKSNTGLRSSAIYELKPDDESIFTPTIKAHIVGSKEKAEIAPLLAPLKKELKQSFLLKRIMRAQISSIMGIMYPVAVLIISIYFSDNTTENYAKNTANA